MKLKEDITDEQIINIAVDHFKMNKSDLEGFIHSITENIPEWKDLVKEDIKRDVIKDQTTSEIEEKRKQLLITGISAEIGGVKIRITNKKDILENLDLLKEFRHTYKNTKGQKSNECVNIHEAAIITQSFCFLNSRKVECSLNDKFYFAGLMLVLFGRLDNKPPKKGYISNDPYRTYLYKNAQKRIKKIIDTRIKEEHLHGTETIKMLQRKWSLPRLDGVFFYPGVDKKSMRNLPNAIGSSLFDLSFYDQKAVEKTIKELWGISSNPL
jgi:hypothetical protein